MRRDSSVAGKEAQSKPVFSNNITCQAVLDFADATVFVVRLTSDENYWIVGLRNGVIKMIPANGRMSGNIQTLHVNGENSCCVDVSCVPLEPNDSSEKNHRLVAVYASGFVRIWHYTAATPESRLLATLSEEFMPKLDEEPKPKDGKRKQMNQILACSCSLDRERFVTGGDDCYIRVYDLNQKKLLRVLGSSFGSDKVDGHVMRICAVKYHPRGSEYAEYRHIFVSGGWDDTVQIWDDRVQHSIWVYAGPHISGSDALDIDPDSNFILTSSWRHDSSLLQLWRFNESAVTQLQTSVNLSDASSAVSDSTHRLDAARIDIAFRERPVAEVPQESFEMRSKGYVARWLGPMYIAFGGSNANLFRIFNRNKTTSIASVTGLPNGVYSVAYVPSQVGDFRRPLQLAFAAGSKVYLTKVERK